VTPAIRAGSSLIEGFGTGVGGPSGGARIFNRSKVPWITLPSFESAGRSSPAHSRERRTSQNVWRRRRRRILHLANLWGQAAQRECCTAGGCCEAETYHRQLLSFSTGGDVRRPVVEGSRALT
jgi:hypothetical protein